MVSALWSGPQDLIIFCHFDGSLICLDLYILLGITKFESCVNTDMLKSIFGFNVAFGDEHLPLVWYVLTFFFLKPSYLFSV